MSVQNRWTPVWWWMMDDGTDKLLCPTVCTVYYCVHCWFCGLPFFQDCEDTGNEIAKLFYHQNNKLRRERAEESTHERDQLSLERRYGPPLRALDTLVSCACFVNSPNCCLNSMAFWTVVCLFSELILNFCLFNLGTHCHFELLFVYVSSGNGRQRRCCQSRMKLRARCSSCKRKGCTDRNIPWWCKRNRLVEGWLQWFCLEWCGVNRDLSD